MIDVDDRGRFADLPQAIDLGVPAIARVYDYLLGGKDNYAADRRLARQLLEADPAAGLRARENRKFLRRAVRFLAAEAGIRQFLDIGAGFPAVVDAGMQVARPAAANVHDVVQAIAPFARVLYVDNDALVLAHARARMTSSPEGRVECLAWDLRGDPARLLSAPALTGGLDLRDPVALLLFDVLPFVSDEFAPGKTIAALVEALPPGSWVAASHVSAEHGRGRGAGLAEAYRAGGIGFQPRDADEFGRMVFPGLELAPPGVVPVPEWRPVEGDLTPPAAEVSCYGGVGRKGW